MIFTSLGHTAYQMFALKGIFQNAALERNNDKLRAEQTPISVLEMIFPMD